MKGPTFLEPPFLAKSKDLSKFCVEGPPEPTIMPVISLEIFLSSKPESFIASFIAI